MKISYNWLKSLGNFTLSPEEVSVLLTDCGLEVEGLDLYETIPGGLKGVVVGQIITCDRHPEADRLWVTTVDTGNSNLLKIVCGAPNAAAGQKVLVATVGTILTTSKGKLEIKKVKIRNQESEGMICAEDELGMGTSHEGIMVLPPDAPVGMAAAQYFGYYNDQIFEIGLTPNRIDAASHFGVARDLAAVINHKNRNKAIQLIRPSVEEFAPDNHSLHIPVVIEDPEKCPRYAGLTISGLVVEESPAWLKQYLLAIGLRPINNIVDVTNYVLHELGHPLHAFDANLIEGRTIVVRCPEKATPFTTLEGKEISLTGYDLMICSASKPMCIGGVLGGSNSGVTASTVNIFLESAYFNPVSIRKTAKAHGIRTDASFRFERGADPEMVTYALKRAALLIKKVAGGKISSEIVDVYPRKIQPARVEFSLKKAYELIGQVIPKSEILEILESLDIQILSWLDTDTVLLQIPTYRVDVTRQVDVIEEILRIYSYNSIELPERLLSNIVHSIGPDREKLQNTISDLLSSRGFYEAMNNSLSFRAYYQMPGFESSLSVDILNPINQDLNVMRQNLLFGGLENILYNQNRKSGGLKLYEFGKVYSRSEKVSDAKDPLSGFSEEFQLGLFMSGPKYSETWIAKEESLGFFDLKSELLQVFTKMGVKINALQVEELVHGPVYEYALRYSNNGMVLAEFGKISKSVLKGFDLKQDVFFAQVFWEKLLLMQTDQKLLYCEVSKFPEVRRDLSLLLDKHIRFADIEALAFQAESNLLKAVRLFDVYNDKRLGENKKSYAVSFTLLDPNGTLTDMEIDGAMANIQKVLTNNLGAEIR